MNSRVNDIIKFREQTNFLGYEFLSWVLLLLERRESHGEVDTMVAKLNLATPVTLTLGNRLVTCLLNHKEQKTTINCPIMEESHELYASLRNGHVVEAISLNMSLGQVKVSFMLHAYDGGITQVKISNDFVNESLVDDEGLSDEDQVLEEIFLRSAALKDLERIIDALYAYFLSVRVDTKEYALKLKLMREQVTIRLGDYLRHHHENLVPSVHESIRSF